MGGSYRKALEWSRPSEEFAKRGGRDEGSFDKKAVNWASRQIGKRNRRLNKLVIQLA
jgi:3-methyladenine DNA glycosylase AlkD